jgi:hypothetical protein
LVWMEEKARQRCFCKFKKSCIFICFVSSELILIVGKRPKKLLFVAEMVLHLQPENNKRFVFFLDKFRGRLTYCFDESIGLKKTQKKHCVIQKSVLHLQPEKHQGVLR